MKIFSPERILANFPKDIQALAQELRKFINKSCPGLEEKAYSGWRAIGWRHSKAGYVFGLFPQENEVKLYFERGASLDDPDRLLIGNQRQVRYMIFRNPVDFQKTKLKKLLIEAVRFGVNRNK